MSTYADKGMDIAEASQEVRSTHVMRELDQQAELVTAVQHGINELEKRLAGVLRSEDEVAEKMVNEPHMPLVPVAEKIHSHNNNLQLSSRRLFNILDRLEL